MSPAVREGFEFELNEARTAMRAKDRERAWRSLARAHILGQFFVGPHLRIHAWMFVYGLMTLNFREIFGQVPRLILAAPGSIFKRAPLGNTGLSNVGIFQPMEIQSDLQEILKR
jgi:hypothetical protein